MPTIRRVTSDFRARLVDRTLPAALAKATVFLAVEVAKAAPVESGELRASVHSTPVRARPGRLGSAVVASSDHALAVEYGTEDMEPEPFFYPSIRRALARARAIVRRAARP